MKSSARQRLRAVPFVGDAAVAAKRWVARRTFPGTLSYWERRYAAGGTSGPGSVGHLARFKADTLNQLVRDEGIASVVEFGCGDGAQLSLADYPRYVGLDVAPTAVRRCATRFVDDDTKSFFAYDPNAFVDRGGVFSAELALSLDVIFHLVEDELFEAHLRHLFAAATRFVVIYGRDADDDATVGYVRDRRFATWVAEHEPGWRLVRRIPNAYPFAGDVSVESASEFFVYEPV